MTAQHPSASDAFASPRVGGWIVSLCLHGTAIVLAGLLVAKMGLAPPSSSFHWDVTVVTEPTETATRSAPAGESVVTPATTRPTQRSLPVAPTPPIASQLTNPRTTTPAPTPKPVEPQLKETPPPPATQQIQTTTDTPTAPPPTVPEKSTNEVPPTTSISQATTEPLPEPMPAAATPQLPESASPPDPASSPLSREQTAESTTSATQTAASVPPTQSPAVARKPDYGWLAATLVPRIESLKQYPAEARIKRLEGRVLLRIVVQEDGQIVSATVAKSSGHEILDQAALETLRKSSPITLTQPLEKSSITLQIPISYQLAQ